MEHKIRCTCEISKISLLQLQNNNKPSSRTHATSRMPYTYTSHAQSTSSILSSAASEKRAPKFDFTSIMESDETPLVTATL